MGLGPGGWEWESDDQLFWIFGGRDVGAVVEGEDKGGFRWIVLMTGE